MAVQLAGRARVPAHRMARRGFARRPRGVSDGAHPMVRRAAASFLLALAILAPPATAQAPPARTELPIHAVKLSNGAVRFGVPIRIGATALEAALDTGSTGLRVLPGALAAADAAASDEPES